MLDLKQNIMLNQYHNKIPGFASHFKNCTVFVSIDFWTVFHQLYMIYPPPLSLLVRLYQSAVYSLLHACYARVYTLANKQRRAVQVRN